VYAGSLPLLCSGDFVQATMDHKLLLVMVTTLAAMEICWYIPSFKTFIIGLMQDAPNIDLARGKQRQA